MKKSFILFAAALFTMNAAAGELPSYTWDFIGDSVSSAYSALQDAMIKGGTLYSTDSTAALFYYGEDFASKPLQKQVEQGLYWRRSTDKDRAIVLTVPGASKATISYAIRPAKTNNDYTFYLFVTNATDSIPTFHGNWDKADLSLDWKFGAYTEDVISFDVDLMDKTEAQNIYLLFLDVKGPDAKDMRLRRVGYEMTDKKDISTALEDAQCTMQNVKVFRNGQLVIIRNGVQYNALGTTWHAL